ncbi:MAG: 2OG-Fe(II)-dependent halogenase WelO5 family protein, partial [Ostreibacterium sp.]
FDNPPNFQAHIAFNMYFQLPNQGGEIEIWDRELDDSKFYAMRNANPNLAYSVQRHYLGKPDVTYRPQKGEIILFNSRKVHAVKASFGVERMTVSCFIGISSEKEPLQLWS